jgi:serine/threonine-protein kinase HipA
MSGPLSGFDWTARHQMSLNGKRNSFERDDVLSFAKVGGIKKKRASQLLEKIAAAVAIWPDFAMAGGVPDVDVQRIEHTFRKHLFVHS